MGNVAVFDINETTLDLAPVRVAVDDLVGPEGGFTVWFQRLLQLSMTVTATGGFEEFGTLARQALDAVADTGSRRLAEGSWDRVAAAMGSLQPYPDVAAGLGRLRDGGWSTIALTNSGSATVTTQLEQANLIGLFDHVLSVDAVGAYKPAAGPYGHAAQVAGVEATQMWMVACHDWDLAGARAAGLSTAFIERPSMSYAATFPDPEVAVADFEELADRLLSIAE